MAPGVPYPLGVAQLLGELLLEAAPREHVGQRIVVGEVGQLGFEPLPFLDHSGHRDGGHRVDTHEGLELKQRLVR